MFEEVVVTTSCCLFYPMEEIRCLFTTGEFPLGVLLRLRVPFSTAGKREIANFRVRERGLS